MRCVCGEIELPPPSMAFGPIQYLPAEIGFVHRPNTLKCSWAFECRDCWNTKFCRGGFTEGFTSELEAHGALLLHLTGINHPMSGRTIIGCHVNSPSAAQLDPIRLDPLRSRIAEMARLR